MTQSSLDPSPELRRLVAGVAHEISTPVQFIGDNLRYLHDALDQLLAELPPRALGGPSGPSRLGAVVEELPIAIAQSVDGVDKLTAMVSALQWFAVAPPPAAAIIDLNQTIDRLCTLARHEWKYVADVQLQLDPHLAPVPGDENALRSLLLELIMDASRAVAGQGATAAASATRDVIRIVTRAHGSTAEIAVTRNGAPPDAALWQIAQAVIVDTFGGHIDVMRTPVEGVCIRLHMPLGVETTE